MNALNRLLVPVFLLGMILASSALAELTVIYDSGQTLPLEPLLKPLRPNNAHPDETANTEGPTNKNPLSTSPLGPAALGNLLPVRSPGLQVGNLADTALKPEVLARLAQGNPRPFFLIGSDQVSLQWLATHRGMLKDLGAVGMLIQADTDNDVRRVADIASGLPITLGAGSDLAGALGVNRYPLLITREGLRQ